MHIKTHMHMHAHPYTTEINLFYYSERSVSVARVGIGTRLLSALLREGCVQLTATEYIV